MKPFKVIVLFLLLLLSCTKRQEMNCMSPQEPVSYKQVLEVLNSIGGKYNDDQNIEFPFTLFEKNEFRDLIDNPCKYKDQLIDVLKDKDSKRAIKLIALFSLQHLCIDDYIKILDALFNEFKEGGIDENLFMYAIDQRGFSLEVFRNQTDQRLKVIFQNTAPLLRIDSNKDLINELLMEKKDWEAILDYCEDVGEVIPWVCR